MFNLNKKINQVRKYIQSLNSEIKQQYNEPESNVNIEIKENENNIKLNENKTKLDDSDIKLTKRSYALDQFIRKRDYIQKKLKEKREDRLKYKTTYSDIDNIDEFLNEQETKQFKKNWKSLDFWLKKNRILDYIERYLNGEIDLKFDTNEDKIKVDKFIKLLNKKITKKSKDYIVKVISKLEKSINYDKKEGIIKQIEGFNYK